MCESWSTEYYALYVNLVSVYIHWTQQQDSGMFLGEAKVHGMAKAYIVIVAVGREVGVSGWELRSPFDTEIIAHTLWAAERTADLAEVGRFCCSKLRCCVVVFHYAARNIYCQVVGWYVCERIYACCTASPKPHSVASTQCGTAHAVCYWQWSNNNDLTLY